MKEKQYSKINKCARQGCKKMALLHKVYCSLECRLEANRAWQIRSK
jgi:hypothetical protein